MTYFTQFPLTTYEFNGISNNVKDIFRRAKFMTEYKSGADIYTPYLISDGETPQSLANTLYGSAFYHWVILIFNEIHDPIFDWPLEQNSIDIICKNKYGDYMHSLKHFELSGSIVGEVKDFTSPWIPPVNPYPGNVEINGVTFYEYETTLNEAKRNIVIMRPELLGDFVTQFEKAINGR